MGDFVALDVASKIEAEFDLTRVMLPLTEDRGQCPATFPILHSKDLLTNPKLIVFVLGAGKVELGQWSRALCINKTLAEGSLIWFLHEAIRVRGCAVLLTNPNVNMYLNASTRRMRRIPGNGSPEDHLYYLFRHFISKTSATEIAIIGHSFGGVSTMTLLGRDDAIDFLLGPEQRLKSITLTDSVHMGAMLSFSLSRATKRFLLKNAINFVRSKDPLGTKYAASAGTQRQSAGIDDHAATTYSCRELLWRWVDARMTKESLVSSPDSNSKTTTTTGKTLADKKHRSDAEEDESKRTSKTRKKPASRRRSSQEEHEGNDVKSHGKPPRKQKRNIDQDIQQQAEKLQQEEEDNTSSSENRQAIVRHDEESDGKEKAAAAAAAASTMPSVAPEISSDNTTSEGTHPKESIGTSSSSSTNTSRKSKSEKVRRSSSSHSSSNGAAKRSKRHSDSKDQEEAEEVHSQRQPPRSNVQTRSMSSRTTSASSTQ